ncbi:hypothetical protein KIW84_073761 [Lathyrus oleraceus]|uniref:Uncharacterized protein n=1 Tax=Pisum sativum TaxID=3888 RepID=A0A9D4VRW2_PEA|nr:hypothetical protein KIW84_073761 [Pisum sativum]
MKGGRGRRYTQAALKSAKQSQQCHCLSPTTSMKPHQAHSLQLLTRPLQPIATNPDGHKTFVGKHEIVAATISREDRCRGKLLDHWRIKKDEELELMVYYLRVYPKVALRDMENTIGAHARFEFLKKVYTYDLLRIERARGDDEQAYATKQDEISLTDNVTSQRLHWQHIPVLELWRERLHSDGKSHVILESYPPCDSVEILKQALLNNKLNYDGEELPLPFNSEILEWANKTQEILSSAKLPSGVKFYNIYGTNLQTPHSIRYLVFLLIDVTLALHDNYSAARAGQRAGLGGFGPKINTQSNPQIH